MIVSPAIMLNNAQIRGYAVPAFNFYNLDGLFAVLEAAEEEKAPIIVELYQPYYPFLHREVFCSAVRTALENAKVPVYFHLDHASDSALILSAIGAGFQSVMADGSMLPLQENIAFTKKIVEAAHEKGVFTEAEMGHVARIGTEDNAASLAEVEDCVALVEQTHVDSLAAAVGTAHGLYRSAPHIDFDRLRRIHEAVSVPLVLHGGSGVPDEAVREAIQCGITKINVGTELKYAWTAAMQQGINAGEKEPRILSAAAREAVKEVAKKWIRLFGASGQSEHRMAEI